MDWAVSEQNSVHNQENENTDASLASIDLHNVVECKSETATMCLSMLGSTTWQGIGTLASYISKYRLSLCPQGYLIKKHISIYGTYLF
jgi:hypothetical protein